MRRRSLDVTHLTADLRSVAWLAAGVLLGVISVVQGLGWPGRLTRLEAAQAELQEEFGAHMADSIPARVNRIESDHRGLGVLLCRAAREDAGMDPRPCTERIRQAGDYLKEMTR